ncbi:MAG: hypothetical protein A2836_01250 [Candidatus Taylorbacteria bacterium RIFCSPHIGHO2_01_FULL_45_63]|uniref:Type II toxin-antitoxin system RelE/ParE family toxin n=1 Tax=Candidatus Taylorbacteria bacterium RIFCSPHIGHO2_02_FULL_45_35 TaxID=1802311 RepID=A0A1G2MPG0_9BACT|nr:MAG: hypothetical protein A2836_01250 [Candidatus Taylorbacteria bacterium RIFCSPHIGHO2_01_FULL_45_63]OHA25775.1 MAG: hypothetical protein A3D56_01580 [Candidatus Taylorbacteria bacterium RIFCSPHIGHO2_02_FULL_45_35]OHA32292.1 MAG: hypothetical protein A3A22_01795 [Candidatus Taylorbacteria bacterium RIFCSPLOWO2_01_FULL_45_34b]
MKKSGNGNDSRWILRYHPAVLHKDIPTLDALSARRIQKTIEMRLSSNPLLYGAPLRGVLLRLFKLRVSDWRIVYEISPPYIDILLIGHRKDAYARLRRRYNL